MGTPGLAKDRTGKYMVTLPGRNGTQSMLLLGRCLGDRWLPELTADLPFMAISLNHGYAARRHRGVGSVGPPMTKAFGRDNGGRLFYWPDIVPWRASAGTALVGLTRDLVGAVLDTLQDMHNGTVGAVCFSCAPGAASLARRRWLRFLPASQMQHLSRRCSSSVTCGVCSWSDQGVLWEQGASLAGSCT